MVIHGVRLNLAEVGELPLEMANPLQCGVEFMVGGDHDASAGMSSTIPLRPPSRLTCQNSIAACSSGHAASLRSQKTLAPKYAWAAAWSKSSREPGRRCIGSWGGIPRGATPRGVVSGRHCRQGRSDVPERSLL